MPYKCEDFGFKIVPKTEILSSDVLECYRGAPHQTAEKIAAMHAENSAKLRERVSQYPGAYVLFSPDDDHEGFVLIGDDQEELDALFMTHEAPNYIIVN